MKKKTAASVLAIGMTCAVAGAAVSGIASSSAATSKKTTTAAASAASAAASTAPDGARPGGPGGGPGGPGGGHGGPGGGGPGGGAVHSETVVPDADGTGFVTRVDDRGTVTKIAGTTLTIKEGTSDEVYRTVDVVADGTVTVRRNGKTAKLASIAVGDHVRVSKDGTTTRIDASTAAWEKAREKARKAEQANRPADAGWPAA